MYRQAIAALQTLLCKRWPEALRGRGAHLFRRGSLRTCSLMAMDRAIMRHMLQESESFWPFFSAPMGGLAALHRKALQDFTAEDAYDLACQTPAFGIGWGWGVGHLVADGEEDPTEVEKGGAYFMTLMGFAGDSTLPLISRASDASVERACLLSLDLLREQQQADQQQQGAPRTTPPMVMVGAWYTIEEGCRTRTAPSTTMIEAGVLELAAAVAKDATPLERLRRIAPLPAGGEQQSAAERRELGVAGCSLMATKEIFENYSVEKLGSRTHMVSRWIDLGLMDCIVDNIRGLEWLGPTKYETAAISNAWYTTWWFMSNLEFSAPELQPVAEMLRREARAVRFALDHPLYQVMGSGTKIHGTAVCACVFGREDGGEHAFVFSQSDIDAVLSHSIEMLRPHLIFGGKGQRRSGTYGHVYALERNQAQCLLALCISDTHKKLILANPDAVTHLVHGLMLDPAYHRSGEADQTDFEGVKAAVQRDYAECLQQLSLFPEGREAMIRDPAVTKALRELVSAAEGELCWSDEARICARGALVALEGPQGGRRELSPERDEVCGGGGGGGGRWVMLSYSWDYQKTFLRLNDALKKIGYMTWIDV